MTVSGGISVPFSTEHKYFQSDLMSEIFMAKITSFFYQPVFSFHPLGIPQTALHASMMSALKTTHKSAGTNDILDAQ